MIKTTTAVNIFVRITGLSRILAAGLVYGCDFFCDCVTRKSHVVVSVVHGNLTIKHNVFGGISSKWFKMGELDEIFSILYIIKICFSAQVRPHQLTHHARGRITHVTLTSQ